MITSWVIIQQTPKDPLFAAYSSTIKMWNKAQETAAMPMPMVDDVCAQAKLGNTYGLYSPDELDHVVHKCERADTFEVLQWVFLSTGVVTTGVGLYIVLSSDSHSSEHASQQPTLSLRPSFSPKAASLSATLRF
jgi:hypothetical protein